MVTIVALALEGIEDAAGIEPDAPVIAPAVVGEVPFGDVDLDVGIFGFLDDLAAAFEELLVFVGILDVIGGERRCRCSSAGERMSKSLPACSIRFADPSRSGCPGRRAGVVAVAADDGELEVGVLGADGGAEFLDDVEVAGDLSCARFRCRSRWS